MYMYRNCDRSKTDQYTERHGLSMGPPSPYQLGLQTREFDASLCTTCNTPDDDAINATLLNAHSQSKGQHLVTVRLSALGQRKEHQS
jgi:hypothetical protein